MTAIVFPGQGSQFINMSKDFYNNFIICKNIYELISDITKIDIKSIIFSDSSDLLNQTEYTQISIFCTSISIYKVLCSEYGLKNLNITTMLGHSLGEYTALTASNYLSIEDCSFLLKKRGELMQNAYEPNKSGMAAIIGMNCEKTEKIIKDNNLKVEIANDNSPLQVVISGTKNNLLDCENIFKVNGAKRFIPLNVSSAFHSFLMIESQKKMNYFIEEKEFLSSNMPIISNFTGKVSSNKNEILDNLRNQMSNRVRWVESIKTLENIGENKIIEIGPGKVLTGLIKRISNNFKTINIDSVSDLKDL